MQGEGNGTPLQYSCLENPMDGGAWWAEDHGVAQSWTRLSDFTFPFHFHALEKEMATHSSVLDWRIPGTGEPGGLPSMGSHRPSWTRLKQLSSSSKEMQIDVVSIHNTWRDDMGKIDAGAVMVCTFCTPAPSQYSGQLNQQCKFILRTLLTLPVYRNPKNY